MAVLPDLDTTNVGVLCYWNATNHGVSEIDPMDVIDYNDVHSYTQYDNGVEGELNIQRVDYVDNDSGVNQVIFNFRVKSDGWILVWTGNENQFGKNWKANGTENYQGWFDVVHNWANHYTESVDDTSYHYGTAPSSFPTTTLSVEISNLKDKLSNSGSITFNHSDVGYYCYEYPNANRMAMAFENKDTDTGGTTIEGGISYTSDTTRHHHSVAAVGGADEFSDFFLSPPWVRFNGEDIINNNGSQEPEFGSVDVLTKGLMPNASTTYHNNAEESSSGRTTEMEIIHFMVYEV